MIKDNRVRNFWFQVIKPGKRPKVRSEFDTHEDAIENRKSEGISGWVLGRFHYNSTWTPSEIFLDCPDSGELK